MRGLEINLNDTRIGGDLNVIEAGIVRGRVALDDDRRLQVRGGGFDGSDEFEIIFHRRHGRHENVQPALARFNADRGAHNPPRGFAPLRRAGRIFGELGLLDFLITLSPASAVARVECGSLQIALTQFLPHRQRRTFHGRVGFVEIGIIGLAHPRQRIERQPEAHR